MNDSNDNTPDVLVSSSSVYGYSYDSRTLKLTVYYKGRSAATHEYSDVTPPMVSQVFDSGGSIGLKARKVLGRLKSVKV